MLDGVALNTWNTQFKDGYSDIPMTILKKYPHPDLLKNKKAETVARYLEKIHVIIIRYL